MTIISCNYLRNGTHNFLSLTRKVQSRKINRRIVVYKDARFITLFQVLPLDDSKFLLVSKYIPIIPYLLTLLKSTLMKLYTHNTVFSKKGTP